MSSADEAMDVVASKKVKREKVEGMPKTKLTLDFKENMELLEQIQGILDVSNKKKYGRKVDLMDLLAILLEKFEEESDTAKAQERTYSKMDRVYLSHEEYNEKNQLSLTLEEYLIRELKIQ